jgi:serine acetyltransferase
VGKHTVIGAGSVVASEIPDYSVAVGNPARVIRRYVLGEGWVRVDRDDPPGPGGRAYLAGDG